MMTTFTLTCQRQNVSLRKFQKVEDAKVIEERESQKITAELHRLGKTSASELTENERTEVLDKNRE